jgi:hypothetical protein
MAFSVLLDSSQPFLLSNTPSQLLPQIAHIEPFKCLVGRLDEEE